MDQECEIRSLLRLTQFKYDLDPRRQSDISIGGLQPGDAAVLPVPLDVALRHQGPPQVDPLQFRERLDGVEKVEAPEAAPGHAEVRELGEELGEVEAVVDVLASPKGDLLC